MAVDGRVLLQVRTQPLGGAASTRAALVDGWAYVLQGEKVLVLRTNKKGIALFDEAGSAPRDEWWEFNSTFKVKVGDVLKACFSRGARPVPESLLVPEVFSDVKVAAAPPLAIKVPKLPLPSGAGAPAVQHSLALRVGVIDLSDPIVALEVPEELTLCAVTPMPLPLGDPYYTQGAIQGAAAFKGEALATPDFDPNRNPPVDTRALTPASDIPLRGLKVVGSVGAQVESVSVVLRDDSDQLIPLCTAETLEQVDELAARLAQGRFEIELFLPTDHDAPAISPSFGLADLVVKVKAGGRSFIESFALHLCGVELGLVDDLDQPQNGRGRVQLGEDEQIVSDFTSPHAESRAGVKALSRTQRLHTYLIRTAFDPTGVAPSSRMPELMIEVRFAGVSRTSLGRLGRHRYRRETGGLLVPVFGAPPPAPSTDGVSRADARTTVSFRCEWEYTFKIDWRARNDDLQARSYGTRPTIVTGKGAAHLRIDGDGGVFGPELEEFRASDKVIPRALVAQPTAPPRRGPELRIDQDVIFGRHKTAEPKRPGMILESLPLFEEPPIARQGSVVALLQKRGVVLPPQPVSLPAIRGGYGEVSLTRLVTGFSQVESTEPKFSSLTAPAVERVPAEPDADALAVLAVRAGGQAKVVPPREPPLALPLIRIAGRNLPQSNAISLLDRFVRSMIPAGGLFFLSQECWVQTARRTILSEAGGRMFNPGTFVHFTTVTAGPRGAQKTHHFGVEAAMPIFGPPNGYGVCQLDPPVTPNADGSFPPDAFGRFDRRLWDYDAHLERGVELLITKARSAFDRFQAGQHYTQVVRKNTVDKKGNLVINAGIPNTTLTTRARDAWVAVRDAPMGRAMLQREVVRSFGGGFEFSFFVDRGVGDVWSTPAKTFWEIHVDNKFGTGPLTRSEEPGKEGQGLEPFGPAHFGPGVNETGAL